MRLQIYGLFLNPQGSFENFCKYFHINRFFTKDSQHSRGMLPDYSRNANGIFRKRSRIFKEYYYIGTKETIII